MYGHIARRDSRRNAFGFAGRWTYTLAIGRSVRRGAPRHIRSHAGPVRQPLEPEKIRLANLTLSNYRNFGDAELELNPGLSVFQGMNGQGKSNLLEAIYLLSVAKSPRASQDRTLVAWDVMANGGHAQIVGVARSNEQTTKIQIDFEAQPSNGSIAGEANGDSITVQKSLRVNGVKRSASDFVGALNVVSFAVEDLELVTGGPAVRRRYLDILISQGDPTYLKALQRYQRVLTQRNNMLRLIRDRRASNDELSFWDERLCEEGGAIIEKRGVAVERLQGPALASHSDLADGDDSLALEYLPALGPSGFFGSGESMTAVQLAASLTESLGVLRDREMARGITTVGPHRDELGITLAGRSAAVFASRGQARTIALSLKYAEGHLVSESTGRSPVLALDDVLSELDEKRRRLVLEAASAYEQVLLTTTDFSFVEPGFLADAETFTVDGGTVGRVGL